MAQTDETEVREGAGSGPAAGSEPASLLQRVPWEALIYAALMAVAASMRLWDLDARAYHYDESIHAFDSWALYQGQGYTHSPWAHGPFMYYLSALGFLLFGDNLTAPRVFPALFATALVLMPLFLRGYLGRWGALATAALLAFSPSLLYFGQFIREDIFGLVFDFGLVIVLWRYVNTRKNRYLYLAAVLLALTFSSKETAYISLAAVGSFLLAWWARDWLPILWSRAKGPRRLRQLRARLTPSRLPPHGAFLLLMVTLSLPLFSAAFGLLVDRLPLDFTLVNLEESDSAGIVGSPRGGGGAYAAAGIIAATLFVSGAIVGLLWRARVWLIAFGAFYSVFFLLHTTFMTNMVGMGTGVWQSLGYWLAQQPVERAGQPWYYYLMLLPLYEFLPFLFSIAAVIADSLKRGRRFLGWAALITGGAILLTFLIYVTTGNKAYYAPPALGLVAITYLALRRGNRFEWFLVHWALASLLLYTVAGEKMPWLLTHMALPFAVLAGRYIGQLLQEIRWPSTIRAGGVALLLSAPLLLLALRALVTTVDPDRSSIGAWSFAGALAFTLILLLAGALLWLRLGNRRSLQMVTVSLLALMAIFTVRAAVQATYVNKDDPVEMLVYSQVSGDVPWVMREIERVARESGKGKELTVLADTSNASFAPWHWYLRNFENVSYLDMTVHQGAIESSVVILSDSNRSKINPVIDKYTAGERFPFLQWFNPWIYRGYTEGQFFNDLVSGRSWSRLLNYFMYRELGSEPALQHAVIYFEKDGS